MTLLSVNLNKVALLRNARGGTEPDLIRAAQTCMDAGCGGITVHPRPNQRHIRPADVEALAQLLHGRVEYNIEGNPFAPARGNYPGLIKLARAARPTQVTLVPDADHQLTSDHGFNLNRDADRLQQPIAELRAIGCRVSLFVDVDIPDFEPARRLGIDRVELYTGPYAQAFAAGTPGEQLQRCTNAARRARQADMAVNAGHDLSQANLAAFCAAVPDLAEVSIGHALIGEALYAGLTSTVSSYLAILRQSATG